MLCELALVSRAPEAELSELLALQRSFVMETVLCLVPGWSWRESVGLEAFV